MRHSKQHAVSADKEQLYRDKGLKKDYDYVFEGLEEMFVAQPLVDAGTIKPDQPQMTEAERHQMSMQEVRRSLPVYAFREQVCLVS